MQHSSWSIALAAGLSIAPSSHPASREFAKAAAAPVRAVANDNRQSAGTLRDGVLTIHLVAQRAAWYPEAEDGPFKVVSVTRLDLEDSHHCCTRPRLQRICSHLRLLRCDRPDAGRPYVAA